MIIMHRKTRHMIIPEEVKKSLNKDLAEVLDVIVDHNLNLESREDVVNFCKVAVKSYNDQKIIDKYFDD